MKNLELQESKKRISQLIRERNNLGKLVYTLRDQLVTKDQQIRYIKTTCYRYGKWEQFITWLKGLFIITIKP